MASEEDCLCQQRYSPCLTHCIFFFKGNYFFFKNRFLFMLVLMLWKTIYWHGWIGKLLQRKNQCTLYGFCLGEKKKKKAASDKLAERKDYLKTSETLTVLWAAALKRQLHFYCLYSTSRWWTGIIKYDNRDNPEDFLFAKQLFENVKKRNTSGAGMVCRQNIFLTPLWDWVVLRKETEQLLKQNCVKLSVYRNV